MIRLVIITVPPREVCRRIDRVRRLLSRLTGSRAGLNYPPHVTLRTGALVPKDDLQRFVLEFGQTVGDWEGFALRTGELWLQPYEAEGQARYFVGYRICKDEPLAALNRRLLGYAPFRKSEQREFNPHVTLLFDDLDRRGFEAAGRFLALHPELSLEGWEWPCDNVGLYGLRGGRWRAVRVFRANPGEP